MLDWAVAQHADGRLFISWLEQQIEWRIRHDQLRAEDRVRIRRWRDGRQASVGLVDEVLTALEIPLSSVPAEVWCTYDNGKRRQEAA
jgi:hypothetical protein